MSSSTWIMQENLIDFSGLKLCINDGDGDIDAGDAIYLLVERCTDTLNSILNGYCDKLYQFVNW